MKILVIRFSSIGDIVLASPVLRSLRNQVPHAEIHFVTKKKFAAIPGSNPHVDKVHVLEKDLWPLLLELKKEKFDCIIDIHNNLRTRLIRSFLWSVKSYVFNKLNLRKSLKVLFKWNTACSHVVHRYLETLSPLGVKNDGAGLEYYFSSTFDPLMVKSMLPQEPFHVYALGGTWFTKRMPADKIASWIGKSPARVVLLGDASDAVVAAELQSMFPNKVLNLCGKLSLDESAFAIQQSMKVISHDSGLMHIAAAMGKPILSIWGNTVPDFGMWAYYDSNSQVKDTRFQVLNLSCRPCSKIGYNQCPKGHFHCMQLQDSEEILSALH